MRNSVNVTILIAIIVTSTIFSYYTIEDAAAISEPIFESGEQNGYYILNKK